MPGLIGASSIWLARFLGMDWRCQRSWSGREMSCFGVTRRPSNLRVRLDVRRFHSLEPEHEKYLASVVDFVLEDVPDHVA